MDPEKEPIATLQVDLHPSLEPDVYIHHTWQEGILLPLTFLLQHGLAIPPGTDNADIFSNQRGKPAIAGLHARPLEVSERFMQAGGTGHEFHPCAAVLWKHKVLISAPNFHIIQMQWEKGNPGPCATPSRKKQIGTVTVTWQQNMNGHHLSLYDAWTVLALITSAMIGEDCTNRQGNVDHRMPQTPLLPPCYSPATSKPEPNSDTEVCFSPTTPHSEEEARPRKKR